MVKCFGHDEAIAFGDFCRVCGKTKKQEDADNWRQEYEDAITERNLLIVENQQLKKEIEKWGKSRNQ